MLILSINKGQSAKKKKKVTFTDSRIQASVPTSAREKKRRVCRRLARGVTKKTKQEQNFVCRFKSVPSPLLRVYFDLVIFVFLIQKGICVCACSVAQACRNLCDLGIEPVSPGFPALQMASLPAKP